MDQAVDIKFEIGFKEWERIRLELRVIRAARRNLCCRVTLQDGRLAGSFTLQAAFELEKFLPA